jgi:hypothetical protein
MALPAIFPSLIISSTTPAARRADNCPTIPWDTCTQTQQNVSFISQWQDGELLTYVVCLKSSVNGTRKQTNIQCQEHVTGNKLQKIHNLLALILIFVL